MVEVRDRTKDDKVMVDEASGEPILKASKCDLCSDHKGGPACERACPHDALMRVDMGDQDSLAEWLNRK
jgi:Fe-S-cluster-containing hydrogenase component 2